MWHRVTPATSTPGASPSEPPRTTASQLVRGAFAAYSPRARPAACPARAVRMPDTRPGLRRPDSYALLTIRLAGSPAQAGPGAGPGWWLQVTTAAHRPAPVGRGELLARLERVLHTRGRALLTGPAGVGKTEVALAAAARAESRGETVLWLATLPADRDIPGAAAAALVATISACASWPAVRPHGGPGSVRRPRRTARSAADRRRHAVPRGARPRRRLGPHRPAARPRPDPADARRARPRPARRRRRPAHRRRQRRPAAFRPASGPVRAAGRRRRDPGGVRTRPTHHEYTQPDAAGPEPLWVPSEADVLFVPPLHADEIAELLIHHRLPSRMAGRIHKASGGNPRLALAVGRSLADAADAGAPRRGTVPLRARPRSRPAAARRRLPRRARHAAAGRTGAAPDGVADPPRRPPHGRGRPRRGGAGESDLAHGGRDGRVHRRAAALHAGARRLLGRAQRRSRGARRGRGRPRRGRTPPGAGHGHPRRVAGRGGRGRGRHRRRRGNSALAAELGLLAAESTPGWHSAQRLARLVDAAEEAGPRRPRGPRDARRDRSPRPRRRTRRPGSRAARGAGHGRAGTERPRRDLRPRHGGLRGRHRAAGGRPAAAGREARAGRRRSRTLPGRRRRVRRARRARSATGRRRPWR